MLAHGCKLSPCSIPLKQKLQLKTKGTVENQLTHIEKLERKTKLLTALTFPSLFICLPSQRNLCLVSMAKKKKNCFSFYQHLLWMGSDPLRTLLWHDLFGSKASEGTGAKLGGGVFSTSTKPTAFRTREFLRARSMILRPETLSGCIDRNPIQTRNMSILQVEKPIFFNSPNSEGFVWRWKSLLLKGIMREWVVGLWDCSFYFLSLMWIEK